MLAFALVTQLTEFEAWSITITPTTLQLDWYEQGVPDPPSRQIFHLTAHTIGSLRAAIHAGGQAVTLDEDPIDPSTPATALQAGFQQVPSEDPLSAIAIIPAP